MKMLIRCLFLSLFSMCLATPVLASPLNQETGSDSWVVKESRDDFDDNLLSLSTIAMDTRGSGGWLSVSCELKDKSFTLNIVSKEYGRRLENVENQKDNLKYVIDDSDAKVVTTTQIIHGTSFTNDINSMLVKDIMSGGKAMKVKFLGDTGSGPVVKFDITGAAPAMEKILKPCR